MPSKKNSNGDSISWIVPAAFSAAISIILLFLSVLISWTRTDIERVQTNFNTFVAEQSKRDAELERRLTEKQSQMDSTIAQLKATMDQLPGQVALEIFRARENNKK